jgi:hypothetical protein
MMNLLLTPISDLGRNNCDDNGSECVVSRDKGLCSLYNTHMLNLLLPGRGGGEGWGGGKEIYVLIHWAPLIIKNMAFTCMGLFVDTAAVVCHCHW